MFRARWLLQVLPTLTFCPQNVLVFFMELRRTAIIALYTYLVFVTETKS